MRLGLWLHLCASCGTRAHRLCSAQQLSSSIFRIETTSAMLQVKSTKNHNHWVQTVFTANVPRAHSLHSSPLT
jgi:hypothetical protein